MYHSFVKIHSLTTKKWKLWALIDLQNVKYNKIDRNITFIENIINSFIIFFFYFYFFVIRISQIIQGCVASQNERDCSYTDVEESLKQIYFDPEEDKQSVSERNCKKEELDKEFTSRYESLIPIRI